MYTWAPAGKGYGGTYSPGQGKMTRYDILYSNKLPYKHVKQSLSLNMRTVAWKRKIVEQKELTASEWVPLENPLQALTYVSQMSAQCTTPHTLNMQ